MYDLSPFRFRFARPHCYLILAYLLLAAPPSLLTQSPSLPQLSEQSEHQRQPLQLRWRFELFAGLGINAHNNSPFGDDPPNLPSGAPAFEPSARVAPSIALSISPGEFRFAENWGLAAGLELAYLGLNGEFSSVETTSLIIQGIPVIGRNEHDVDLSLNAVSVMPWLELRYADFRLRAGPQVILFSDDQYDQSETILDPPLIEFDEGGRTRRIFNDNENIERDDVLLAAEFALAYDFFLDDRRRLAVSPEIGFQPGGFELSDQTDWSVRSTQFGLRLSWFGAAPPQPTVIRDSVYVRDTTSRIVADLDAETVVLQSRSESIRRDTLSPLRRRERTVIRESWLRRVPAPQELLVAALEAELIDAEGRRVSDVQLSMDLIEEEVLLPISLRWYNPSFPRNRYPLAAELMQERAFADRDLNVLDTIGRRLAADPQAGLTIRTQNALLPRELRKYLQDNWSVAPQQIVHLDAEPLGAFRDPGVRAQAQLSSNRDAILAPIHIRRRSAYSQEPLRLRMRPYVLAEAGLSSWRLRVRLFDSNTLPVFSQEGQTSPPPLIEWTINPEVLPAVLGPHQQLECSFVVVDSSGRAALGDPVRIRFRQLTHSDRLVGQQVRIGLNLDDSDPQAQLDAYAEILQRADSIALVGMFAPDGDPTRQARQLAQVREALAPYGKTAVQSSPGLLRNRASEPAAGGVAEHINLFWLIIR